MPQNTARIRVNDILLFILLLQLFLFQVPSINATEEDSWTTKAPMPTARGSFGVAVVDGKIFAIGGKNSSITYLTTNEMYDPVTDSWTEKKSMPTARASFGIAVYQNKIYVIGGRIANNYTYTGANEVYDPLTDTWETKKPSPTPRDGFDANVLNGKIHLIGGKRINLPGYSTQPYDVNDVYNPSSDTWTIKAPLPVAVYDYTSAVIDNKIYVIGGSGTTLNQIYNPENDTWSNGKASPYSSTYGAGAATLGLMAPKRMYIMGGGSLVPIDGNVIYDPEIDDYSNASPLPTARNHFGLAVVNDVLYAIGGVQGEMGGVFAVNEQYIPIGYIPEFPSWAILPLFGIITLISIIIKKRIISQES